MDRGSGWVGSFLKCHVSCFMCPGSGVGRSIARCKIDKVVIFPYNDSEFYTVAG